MWRGFLAAVLCCAAAAAPAVDEPLGARTALELFLRDLHTLAADFTQQVLDETGSPIETSSGILRVWRPGRFSWIYREPYQQTIVSNGSTLWMYDEDLAQVTISPVTGSTAGSAAALLGDEVDLSQIYKLKQGESHGGLDWVELVPRTRDQQYTEVAIGMRGNVLASMRLVDNLGQTTVIEFQALERNPPLAPELFEFEIPDGVDVVSGTGGDTP